MCSNNWIYCSSTPRRICLFNNMPTGNANAVQMKSNPCTKKRKPPLNYFKMLESNRDSLKTSGYLLIHCTLTMTAKTRELSVYMDEMLHSIFFLGHIFKPSRLAPSDFFKNSEIFKTLEAVFPGPFEKYKTHLPTRTPFSILLSMMEKLYCTEESIKKELLLLLEKLKFPNPLRHPGNKNEEYYTLESTVICVCSSDSDSRKYFGASLSCRKGDAQRILIDISCLKTWHNYVAHAIMSFYEPPGDGITFPETIKCQAYIRDWNRNVYEDRQPCLNCKHLFNLPDTDQDKVHNAYGNCAETEGLSKLLLNNRNIQEKAVINNHTEENLEKLKDLTKARLMNHLEDVGFEMNDLLFYTPMPRDNVLEAIFTDQNVILELTNIYMTLVNTYHHP